MKILLVIAGMPLMVAVAGKVWAQSEPLRVMPASEETISRQPREVVSLTFAVRNDSNRALELEPHLLLPAGWRMVTQDLPFTLAGSASSIRLASFMIPQSAEAGEYLVTYEVQQRQQPAIRDACTVRVFVLPLESLKVAALEAPSFAIAGERFKSSFVVRNTGNAPISAAFQVRSVHGSKLTPQAGSLQLDPGRSTQIEIEITAPATRHRIEERITLSVQAENAGAHGTSSATQVVPRISVGEAYHTLATQVDMGFIIHQTPTQQSSGWQLGVSGSGALDETETRRLDFRLRGPDVRDRGSFGATDEYWLRYRNRASTWRLGDDIYGLSLLTEPGRYGRGGGFAYDTSAAGWSAFAAEERFAAANREQLGFNAHLRFAPARLDLNLLERRGGRLPAAIYSMGASTRWSGGASTLELAQSQAKEIDDRGRALRWDLYDATLPVHYYVTGWYADPEYRGYLRDERYLTAGFDYPLHNRSGLHGYYRHQQRNLDQHAEHPAAREHHANLGLSRGLWGSSRLALDFNLRAYADSHATPVEDIENRALRLALSQTFKNISLLYSSERGRTRSPGANADFATALHTLSASWQPGPAQSYGLYAMYDDNAYARRRQNAQTSFGLNANYTLGSTTIGLDAQRSYEIPHDAAMLDDAGERLDPSPYARSNRSHSIYSMRLAQQWRNGDRITLLARRITGPLPQSDLWLTYAVPFDLPLLHRTNVGAVRGRVFDTETGIGVRSVVLSLDGLTAVSSANGEYEFPAVPVGSYLLSLDRSNIDVEQVPRHGVLLQVKVDAGNAQRIDIPLVRSASVSVDVTLQPGDDARPRGLPNVLITMSQGEQIYRRLTDARGHVQLAGLPPGEWTVSISADAVPQGYTVASRERSLRIEPGAAAEARFRLTPVVRDIRLLPPLKLR